MFIFIFAFLLSSAQGDGDECCHFKVLKMKDKGFVKLQSVAEPDLFVGFNLDGTVHPLPDDGNTFLSIFPAIEQGMEHDSSNL